MDMPSFLKYWRDSPCTRNKTGSNECADKRFDIDFNVKIHDVIDDDMVMFLASAPPDYGSSFTGSGMPFHSMDQAFERTPNTGMLRAARGTVHIRLQSPNTFYSMVGLVRVDPTVYLMFRSNGRSKLIAVSVGCPVPFRDLTYDCKRNGPEFYKSQFVVETQYDKILRRNYPWTDHDNVGTSK